ncbi:MAG: peptidylprolyl isomerase, partial [Oscillospiraceae bacterium]|nr:peptidylprolyl isomerase [Oscillospiraceae bacterium]
MKRISAVVLALLLLCSCCLLSGCGKDKYSAYVKIDVKDFGEMIVGLRADKAPDTVANFLSLVDQGFYDGLTFHRIMTNF